MDTTAWAVAHDRARDRRNHATTVRVAGWEMPSLAPCTVLSGVSERPSGWTRPRGLSRTTSRATEAATQRPRAWLGVWTVEHVRAHDRCSYARPRALLASEYPGEGQLRRAHDRGETKDMVCNK